MNKLTQKQLNKKYAYTREWKKNNRDKINAYDRKWYKNNIDKRHASACKYYKNNSNKVKIASHIWAINNPDKVRIAHINWTRNNLNKVRAIKRKWQLNNPDQLRAISKKYFATNANARIKRSLRSRLSDAILSQSAFKKGHLKDLIGISIPELKQHLEQQFKSGMTWDNYGRYRVDDPKRWNIDHIVALAHFDLTKLSEQKKAMDWKNLQPMWAMPNMQKSDKFISYPFYQAML